jgi:hypothetical protein
MLQSINEMDSCIFDFLSALNLTADIRLRPSREGEGPLKVVLESPGTYQILQEE